MNRFLSADENYRKQMIEYVRESVNLPHKSIEKDLWVTQVLHALFSLPVSDRLIFKGGTSLGAMIFCTALGRRMDSFPDLCLTNDNERTPCIHTLRLR